AMRAINGLKTPGIAMGRAAHACRNCRPGEVGSTPGLRDVEWNRLGTQFPRVSYDPARDTAAGSETTSQRTDAVSPVPPDLRHVGDVGGRRLLALSALVA